eukprot:CAMPEP_0169349038 /NCGR_PEP_ID=MMETSP1017-20121227/23499_1 /TAXON_ID=342587 /ORGANISM="Karlodinium micrum, Strain CCMP2283" /LENGTH=73 /DNA_ID=CAMNT_0009445139 /DNA_START=200 /DNA_END=421 /DNA_ORIENTATION=+
MNRVPMIASENQSSDCGCRVEVDRGLILPTYDEVAPANALEIGGLAMGSSAYAPEFRSRCDFNRRKIQSILMA